MFVGVGAVMVVVTVIIGGIIQVVTSNGTVAVVEELGGKGAARVDDDEAGNTRFAFEAGDVAVVETVAVAALAIDMGQNEGWGVAAGGTRVPLTMVRVIVDPLMPPMAVLGMERVDTDGIAEDDAGGGLATEWEVEAAFEVVPTGTRLPPFDEDGGGAPQSNCAAEFTEPGIDCDKTLREFSAWGIYVSTPAMRERR